MFQFTRDFIINDNIGHLKNEKGELVRFKTITGCTPNKDNVLLIDGAGANLYSNFVKNVTVHRFHPAVNEKLEINLSVAEGKYADLEDAKDGDIIRMVINLGQEGREISTFNDNSQHHTRQYFYEGTVCEGKLDNAWEEIMRGYQRDMNLSDLRYFTMSLENPTLTLEANDCYTRFFSVRIVRVNKMGDRRMMGESRTGYKDYDVLFLAGRKDRKDYHWETLPGFVKANGSYVDGVTNFIEGSEGNGTVARLIKNMRVPTFEHMDWFGTMRDELPVPSGEYDQYMIEYVTPRRQIGHQVFGSYNDASLVTLVFFVKSDVVEEFETELVDKWLKGSDVTLLEYAKVDADTNKMTIPDYFNPENHPEDGHEDDKEHVNSDLAAYPQEGSYDFPQS